MSCPLYPRKRTWAHAMEIFAKERIFGEVCVMSALAPQDLTV